MKKKKLSDREQIINILKRSVLIDKRIDKVNATNYHDEISELNERVKKTIELIKNYRQKRHTMLYFVMYDIENDKVRRLVAKYLERKGLIRIQKSVFAANTEIKVFEEIRQTLKEVQEAYENNDSIILVPISADELRSMKIIGKNIDLDLISGNTHTLFF